MTTPTRYTNGVSSAVTGVFKDYPFLNPTDYIVHFDDFIKYVPSDWTITETDAAATQAQTTGQGGQLLITNTAADNDLVSLQHIGPSFLFVAGKKTFFEVRFRVTDATQSDLLFGLVIADTTPFAHTDGMVIRKDDGSANVDFVSLKDSAGTTESAWTTISDATFAKLGFYFDGTDVQLFKDGIALKRVLAPTICDDEVLRLTFAIQNGEAVAKLLVVDYIFVAQER